MPPNTATKKCVFCGSVGQLTREHVFGNWLSAIGISQAPVQHSAGPLNCSPRHLGVRKPFTDVVCDVCSACNNGWLSELEQAAKRILTPFILGRPGLILATEQSVVAAWAHKTILVNMLVSSDSQRSDGYGVPKSEYESFHSLRVQKVPLPQTQFWIGQYHGERIIAEASVTPMLVHIAGEAAPKVPYAYAMTLVVGKLLIQGLRFTTPMLCFDVETQNQFSQIWPPLDSSVSCSVGKSVDDKALLNVSKGLNMCPKVGGITLTPWSEAVDLPRSVSYGALTIVSVPCGKHFTAYPTILACKSQNDPVISFYATCDCGKGYIFQTESDGTHFKVEGEIKAVRAKYDEIPKVERAVWCDGKQYFYKR